MTNSRVVRRVAALHLADTVGGTRFRIAEMRDVMPLASGGVALAAAHATAAIRGRRATASSPTSSAGGGHAPPIGTSAVAISASVIPLRK